MSSSSSSTTQVVSLREMGMYEPFQQLSGWENAFNTIGSSNQNNNNNNNNPSSSTVPEVDARADADDNNKVQIIFPFWLPRFMVKTGYLFAELVVT